MFEYLCFTEHTWPNSDEELRLDYSDGKLYFKHSNFGLLASELEGEYEEDIESFVKKIEDLHIENWNNEYFEPILDGHSWTLTYKQTGKKYKHITGSNSYPENYEAFHTLIHSVLLMINEKK